MAASSDTSKGQAKFCSNCISKMEMLDIRPLGVYCKCSNCQSKTFSVCGGCRMVPYCSKECQKEHWKSNHKARCVLFSSEKNSAIERAMMAQVARMGGAGEVMCKQINKTERLMESHIWALFKSDCGMLEHDKEIEEEDLNRADGSLCPVDIVDYRRNGWIAEHLNYLNFLVSAILGSV